MPLLTYESIKNKPKTLIAMTSLKRSEFDELLESFAKAWDEDTGSRQMDASKGGRPPILECVADRLLFILFYFKTYPLQEVIAHISRGHCTYIRYEPKPGQFYHSPIERDSEKSPRREWAPTHAAEPGNAGSAGTGTPARFGH